MKGSGSKKKFVIGSVPDCSQSSSNYIEIIIIDLALSSVIEPSLKYEQAAIMIGSTPLGVPDPIQVTNYF